jgi:hypothetical protein
VWAVAPLPDICCRTRAGDPDILPTGSRNRWRLVDGVSQHLNTATNGRPDGIVGYQKRVALLSDEGQRRFSGMARAKLESASELLSRSNLDKVCIRRHLDKSHRRYAEVPDWFLADTPEPSIHALGLEGLTGHHNSTPGERMIRSVWVPGDLPPCVATLDFRPEPRRQARIAKVDDSFQSKRLHLLAHVITQTIGSLRD